MNVAATLHHRMIEANAELRLLLLFRPRLCFGDASQHFRIFGDDEVPVCSFQILHDLGFDRVARFRFFGVNGLRELYRNYAARGYA